MQCCQCVAGFYLLFFLFWFGKGKGGRDGRVDGLIASCFFLLSIFLLNSCFRLFFPVFLSAPLPV
ncbi:hypothetical protein B0T24DRAFT_274771 [Lasiosphaeria ovina]|uniref:Uncharacterized protein n=1 Tax=Lasiosphaeria ovina TaxID=92902 RepID=A0AAE0KBI1_9PEZI|nr:hypothetical protein B0T24DRAFT_274771 [Lasiosphaeria ovina]